MQLESLRRKLIAAARAHPPGDAAPLAFEQRIMARLRALPETDPLTQWVAGLWRAAVPCVAVMVFLCAINFLYAPAAAPAESQADDLETVLTQPFHETGDTW
jgi:hypothetical protein